MTDPVEAARQGQAVRHRTMWAPAHPKATGPHGMKELGWGSAGRRGPSSSGRALTHPSHAQSNPAACHSSPVQGWEQRHGQPLPPSQGVGSVR